MKNSSRITSLLLALLLLSVSCSEGGNAEETQTSDVSPEIQNNEPEEKLTDADTIIMEIKCLNSMELWLASRLDELGIYPGNFSKYGQIYTNRIMKGVKTCLNSYSHQYIHQPSHLRYSSSVQLHQSF